MTDFLTRDKRPMPMTSHDKKHMHESIKTNMTKRKVTIRRLR